MNLYHYRCRVLRAIDGDTVEAIVDLGMDIHHRTPIRLVNVDAPELNEPHGVEMRDFVNGWLAAHSNLSTWPFLVHTYKDKRSFNRYLGVITDPSGYSLNAAVNEELARG